MKIIIFYDVCANNEKAKLRQKKDYKKVLKKISGCSLIVLRVDSLGRLVESKPCVDCTQQIKKLNIKNVYYSTAEGKINIEKVKNLQTEHKCRSRKKEQKKN